MLTKKRCCCTGTGKTEPPTKHCCPCDFPKEDLKLVYLVNPFWVPEGDPNPPITLSLGYRSGTNDWSVLDDTGEWTFNCSSGSSDFCLHFSLDSSCCSSNGDWNLIDYTCSPLMLHFQAPNTGSLGAECACDQDPTGFCGVHDAPPLYLEVWISFSSSVYVDDFACTTNTIHVRGCNGLDLPGATIEIKDLSGTTVDGGTTDSDGLFTASANGFPYSVTVSKERFTTTTFPGQALGCCVGITLDMGGNIADGYHCMDGCVDPVADTLHGTHDVFGSLTFTYDPSGSDGPGWYDILRYSYPGCLCCSPTTVTVTCHLSAGGTYIERWQST